MSVSHVDIDPDGDLIIALPPQDLRYKPFSDADKKGDSIKETRLKVSVKHLTLASRRAKVMFASNFIEAQPDAEGYRHWKFEPLFDPSAFEIVMYAVHGKTQKLPDTVTLETLTQIAVILDDLETYQALCFAAKRWIKRLGDQGGKGPFRIDLARYILVSFVFDEPEMFGAMTKRAIFNSNQPFHSFELPIRPKILGMFVGPTPVKPLTVNSSVVRNPKSAWHILEGMDHLALPNGNGRRSGPPISLTDHDCRLRKFAMSEIGGLNTAVEGLKLSDFKSTVRNSNLPVKSLEVSTDGGKTWKGTTRQDYNFFENSSGFGTTTVDVRVTSSDGQTIVVKNVGVTPQAEYKAASNFS
ncbi:hypothetical protein FALBO_13873 [Fusarium albosuccineum]|uniref:BTB domain-containing protein n=1 Tax=Fusarium albosuccineum TaxID=1237068 RepID=A0A8H4P1S8_9HYPO|nr:hypothetical protein FALBO_13873 [Fusarium albosuccineum]